MHALEQLRAANCAQWFEEATTHQHVMGTWQWLQGDTVHARCLHCNAGVIATYTMDGGVTIETIGVLQDCLIALADQYGLVTHDVSGSLRYSG